MVEILQITEAPEDVVLAEASPYSYDNHTTPTEPLPVFSAADTTQVLSALPSHVAVLHAARQAEQSQPGFQPTAMYEDSPYAGMAPVRFASPAVRQHIGTKAVTAFNALLEKKQTALAED